MANKKRFTFFTDDYPAVTCDSCYEDQNEYYTGPAIDRLAEYEATGLMPAEVAALTQELKYAKQQCREERRWVPVTERLPDEHESLFAHYKGTDKWCDGMFMTISDLVIVCAEYENMERIVKTANTTEGIWKVKDSFYPCRVTHWMPLPEPPEKAINQDHNQGKENDYGNQSE